MKNALYTILFIFIFGNICHFGLDWWTLVLIAAMSTHWFPMNAWAAWASGFIGGFLLWFVNALLLDNTNQGMLSGKVGQLFLGLQSWQLMLVAGLLGGLLGAFGVLTGKFGRELFVGPKQKLYSA